MLSPLGPVTLLDHEGQLAGIVFEDRQAEDASELLTEAQAQLNAYFKKERRRFDLPLHFEGTEFQKSVWQALLTVDYGCTQSYLDIAKRIGNPDAVRAVGAANGKNPIGIIVPCHRVIGANGQLTGYDDKLWRKKRHLQHEDSAQYRNHQTLI